ncbi:MAG: hypothetical protein ACD_75C02553G0001 [uncultured bacterium]|nr:MAG: hypothetical protein ACD_75C02553G0001 [uncultured bacterium]
MKTFLCFSLVPIAILLLLVAPSAQGAQDMREQQVEARTSVHNLKVKAAAEEEAARQEAARSREKIAGDRTLLDQEVPLLETEVGDLEKAVARPRSRG